MDGSPRNCRGSNIFCSFLINIQLELAQWPSNCPDEISSRHFRRAKPWVTSCSAQDTVYTVHAPAVQGTMWCKDKKNPQPRLHPCRPCTQFIEGSLRHQKAFWTLGFIWLTCLSFWWDKKAAWKVATALCSGETSSSMSTFHVISGPLTLILLSLTVVLRAIRWPSGCPQTITATSSLIFPSKTAVSDSASCSWP